MSDKDKVITEDQAFLRMARMCSRKEYSPFDIRKKLNRLKFSEDVIQEITTRLKHENYINEERYIRSFANDKLKFNGWGIKKIEMHLRQKQLPQDIVEKVFSEFSSIELNSSLLSILEKKWKSVKGETEYEKKAKLIRYALGRGFEMSEILSCINNINLSKSNKE